MIIKPWLLMSRKPMLSGINAVGICPVSLTLTKVRSIYVKAALQCWFYNLLYRFIFLGFLNFRDLMFNDLWCNKNGISELISCFSVHRKNVLFCHIVSLIKPFRQMHEKGPFVYQDHCGNVSRCIICNCCHSI